jgi:hypothetical protein
MWFRKGQAQEIPRQRASDVMRMAISVCGLIAFAASRRQLLTSKPPLRFRLPAAWFSGGVVLGGHGQAIKTAAARQADEAQNSIKASNYSSSEFRARGGNKTVTAAKQTPATVNHANCSDSFIWRCQGFFGSMGGEDGLDLAVRMKALGVFVAMLSPSRRSSSMCAQGRRAGRG